MPNWVTNYVDLNHPDPARLQEMETIYDKCVEDCNELFQSSIPCPADLLDGDGWYEWRIKHWGTKWDAVHIVPSMAGDDVLRLQFDTAWSPPLPVYDALLDLGFYVKAC